MGSRDQAIVPIRPSSNLTMKTLVLCLLAASATWEFCPGEKGGNRCVAKDKAYKCAVFFENLTSKRPLTWIGALPDALKKAKNKQEAQEILGADVTEESFNNSPRFLRQKLDQHQRVRNHRRLSLQAGQKVAEKG